MMTMDQRNKQNGMKWSKTVQSIQNCLRRSNMVQSGHIWLCGPEILEKYFFWNTHKQQRTRKNRLKASMAFYKEFFVIRHTSELNYQFNYYVWSFQWQFEIFLSKYECQANNGGAPYLWSASRLCVRNIDQADCFWREWSHLRSSCVQCIVVLVQLVS